MTKPQTRQTHLVLAALIALVALLALGAQAHAKKYLYVFHFDELTYHGITYPADEFSFTSPALIGPGPTEIPGSTFIDSLNLASPLDLNGCSFSTIRCNDAGYSAGNLNEIDFTADYTLPFTVGQVCTWFARINFPPGTYGPGVYTSAIFGRAIAISSGGFNVGYTTGSLIISEVADISEAAGYKFTTIDVPGGFIETRAFGINDVGHIVGDCTDSNNAYGFSLKGEEYAFINYQGYSDTHPADINNAGLIVGGFHDSTGTHGFIFDIDFPPLDFSDASYTFAYGINKTGKIVGEYIDSSFKTHGFLWEMGFYNTLDVLNASHTKARRINDAGWIVGYYEDGTGTHGFLRVYGVDLPLNVPDASNTFAWGINNAGQIVGAYVDSRGAHGFLLNREIYTSINVPGALSTVACDINNAGQIVGFFNDSTGTHGFLATPIHRIIPSIMLLLE